MNQPADTEIGFVFQITIFLNSRTLWGSLKATGFGDGSSQDDALHRVVEESG